MIRKATSFALIGLLNTGVDAGVFVLALQHLDASLIGANVLAWAVAVSFSYVLNARMTFSAETSGMLSLRDYLRFVASGIGGLIANTTTLVLVAQVAPVWAAKLAAIFISFVVNFTLAQLLVFRRRA